MRVISGELGGRRLVAPSGTSTRPTTDKMRQAVFNSLQSMGVVDGALVVDLFAGSGAMGIEALSRGAERCLFVERDRDALRALRDNIAALGLADRARIVAGDVMSVARGLGQFDVALVDPPYSFDEWPALLAVLDAQLVVAESGDEVAAPDGWEQLRTRRHGRTVVTTLERLP
jgi:16S rRNA (guanine966-N2)-methyltransferase